MRWSWRRRQRTHQPLFQLGAVVVSAPAREALRDARVVLGDLLARHQCGDWGQVDEIDAKQNELGLRMPMRIRSIYTLPTEGGEGSISSFNLLGLGGAIGGDDVWVVTSPDRTTTRVFLPREIFDEQG